jgi:serine protease AprX
MPAPRKSSPKKAKATEAKKAQTVSMAGKPTSKAIPPPDKVSIEVLLRPTDVGLSPISASEKISFSNVENFRPAKATQDQAAARLTDLGFKVVAVSPYSISLEGPPSLFTKTFGTDLEVRSVDRVQSTRPMREKSFYTPAGGADWQAPAALADVVERAYIQPPAIYFESALPPKVNYFHLNVPSDVAMLTGASGVHHQGITGKGVKVVMIDSGFFKHKYYNSHGYKASLMLGPGAIEPKRDDNGHGTAEAANVFANAPNVTFIMIKQGDNSTAAFKVAVGLKPDIITCSWGFDLVDSNSPNRKHLTSIPNFLKPLELEVARAVANGIVVIFSAGNGHVSFPGMHPDVISAGGVYVDQEQNLRASDYASAFDSKPYPGRHVPDLCGLVGLQPHAIYIMLPLQPGCAIDTELSSGGAFPNSDETQPKDGWGAISGTSAAAPQLAGICALLKQKKPALTPQEVKQALIASARDCDEGAANEASNEGVALEASAGIDGATGHGLVDAIAAIELV